MSIVITDTILRSKQRFRNVDVAAQCDYCEVWGNVRCVCGSPTYELCSPVSSLANIGGVGGGVGAESRGLTEVPTRCGCHKLLIKRGKSKRYSGAQNITYAFYYGRFQFQRNCRGKYPPSYYNCHRHYVLSLCKK